MTTHTFTVEVQSRGTRKNAEAALLAAFALRAPDGCKFQLVTEDPRKQWRDGLTAGLRIAAGEMDAVVRLLFQKSEGVPPVIAENQSTSKKRRKS